MSHRRIPDGATITRTYLAVPSGPSIGQEFPNTHDGWDAAVTAAQAKKADLVASLTETMGRYATPAQIEETADVQVCLDLRWKIDYPTGGGVDTVIERYQHVDVLRTNASFRPAGATR